MRIIDLHAHIGRWFFAIERDTVQDFLQTMDRNDIELSVVSSTCAVVHDFQAGNRQLAQALRAHERLLGMLFLNPNYLDDSLDEMDRYLSDDRFVGLGELYHKAYIGDQAIDSSGHIRILERLVDRFSQRLVLFHCFGDGYTALAQVADAFPQIRFIAGHMGGPSFEAAAQRLKGLGNVYLEVCSSSPLTGKIETAVQAVGPARVVFGSDASLLDPAFTIGAVLDSRISDADKERIFYLNAKGLLGI